jgi:hypothetical protein
MIEEIKNDVATDKPAELQEKLRVFLPELYATLEGIPESLHDLRTELNTNIHEINEQMKLLAPGNVRADTADEEEKN